MVDFFKTHVKVRAVWRQIVESKIWQYFYDTAPGLKELILMGKIWRLMGEKGFFSARPTWDMLIVDAPATGHGLSLLNVPQAAYETLFGPMKKNAEKIRDMVRDARTTVLNIVTMPEEMPVNEAIELYRAARDRIQIATGVLFMNAVYPPLLADDESRALFALEQPASEARPAVASALGGEAALGALLRCARSRDERAAEARRYTARIREDVSLPLVPVPFVFDADFDTGTLEAVADELAKAFGAPPHHPKRTAAPA
jgi:hypothetical protein